MMLRAAAMLQPAHDRLVPVQHLHAVDAEIEIVLARVAGPFGHHQRPGDQRRRLARPAGLDRQRDRSMSRRAARSPDTARACTVFGFIAMTVFASGSRSNASPKLRGGSGWRSVASSSPTSRKDFASRAFDSAHRHAHRHALDGAEQIDQHRDARSACHRL